MYDFEVNNLIADNDGIIIINTYALADTGDYSIDVITLDINRNRVNRF